MAKKRRIKKPKSTPLNPKSNQEQQRWVKDDECIYTLFGIQKTASVEEIKQRYRKLALQYHPDRHTSKSMEFIEESKRKFQQFSYIFSILSDPQKKKRYDRTGSLENLDTQDAFEYFEAIYRSSLTVDAIEQFKKEYQGSEEEKRDLMASYLEHQGDLDKILNGIPCSEVIDESRFRQILHQAIQTKVLPAFRLFTHEPKQKAHERKRKAEEEAKEATELANVLGIDVSSEFHLQQLIQTKKKDREQSYDQFLDHLVEKYVPPKPSKHPPSPTTSTLPNKSSKKEVIHSSSENVSDRNVPTNRKRRKVKKGNVTKPN